MASGSRSRSGNCGQRVWLGHSRHRIDRSCGLDLDQGTKMESIGRVVAAGDYGDVVCANLGVVRESLVVAFDGRSVSGESGVCGVVARIPRYLWRNADYGFGMG